MQVAFFFIFIANLFSLSNNKGLFAHFTLEQSYFVISHFLPYDPIIVVLGGGKTEYELCKKNWPDCTLSSSFDCPADLLILCDGCTLSSDLFPVESLRVVYNTSSFWPQLDGLTLCTEWNEENRNVSFYLKNEIYQGFLDSIQFNPQSPHLPIGSFLPSSIFSFFAGLEQKSKTSSISQVDCLYMINLDARREKYEASLYQLQRYGMNPFRFSAIDGSKIPVQWLDELGVRLSDAKIDKKVMGKVFREVDGMEYRTIEFIEDPQLTYFCTGITRGAIGCLLSHLSVLQDAWRSNYQIIWVVEDDIQIVEDPHQLSFMIMELNGLDPDWDILFTDTDSRDPQGRSVPCRALAMRPDVSIEPLASYLAKFKRINDRISKVGMRYGTYSMILSRSGVEKILDYYKTYAIYSVLDKKIS